MLVLESTQVSSVPYIFQAALSMRSVRSGISDNSADNGLGNMGCQGFTTVGVYKGNRVALKMINYALPIVFTKENLLEFSVVSIPLKWYFTSIILFIHQ